MAGILVAVILGARTVAAVRPFILTPERMAVLETARWFRASPFTDRLVVSSHVWFAYAADMDRYNPRIHRFMNPASVESAPPGSIIIWDRHFSPRLHFLVPLETLQDPARFRPLYRGAGGRKFDIHVFEKMF